MTVLCAALVGLATAQVPVPSTCANNGTVTVNGTQVQQWVWQTCDMNGTMPCPGK
jgi:hypothetical protein